VFLVSLSVPLCCGLCVAGAALVSVNATATPGIFALSLHDALPIWDSAYSSLIRRPRCTMNHASERASPGGSTARSTRAPMRGSRSEEHTSELQSRENLVCRLLLEKKKTTVSTVGQNQAKRRSKDVQ